MSSIKKAKSLSFNNKKTSSISHVANTSFIFFGCWNNINCSKNEKTLNRNVVLELLKNLYSNMPIVLAGDNWYSQKIKLPKLLQSANASTSEYKKIGKFKFYPLYVLKTGYKKLFEISKKIDIVLGNHDINPDKLNDFYDLNQCDQLGCMVKVQTDIISKMLLNPSSHSSHSSPSKPIQNIYHYNDVKLYVCKPHIEEKSKGIFFLYLNSNFDGRTSFSEYDMQVYPKAGRLLMFPPTWTYLHAGYKPKLESKYIIGSYLHYV